MANDLFRITCFVNDKHLGDVLRSLAGSGAFDVIPTPVINAEAVEQPTIKSKGNGTLLEFVMNTFPFKEDGKFRRSELARFLKANGRHPNTSGNLLKTGVERGLFKRDKSKGQYINISK
jgi:hypothetical protein